MFGIVMLGSSAAPAQTAVIVSRREVRVAFSRDTAHAWGWPARRDPRSDPSYIWSISIDGMDGPRSLSVRADRERDQPRIFASLAELIAAARAEFCLPGMMQRCESSRTRATVDNGRVVLIFRDSAEIARLFGMRPATVEVWNGSPGNGGRFSRDSARVEYIVPQIPLPDSATRDDAARSRRRYEASVSMIWRYIAGGSNSGPLVLEVGDSAAVYVAEQRCHYDVCTSGSTPLDEGWSIVDSSIARLRLVRSDSNEGHTLFIFGGTPRYVKALRPGRTTLQVRGIRSALDSAPSSKPPERDLDREIIVKERGTPRRLPER